MPYLMHIATTSHLRFSHGPWIPQTPDSQQESDLQEQWREGDEENEEEDE